MDNLSAGTRFLLVQKKERTSQLPSAASPREFDSDMSSTDSDGHQKLDGFPSESVDALRRNYWMDSFGISGCFRSESLSEIVRNTHPPPSRSLGKSKIHFLDTRSQG